MDLEALANTESNINFIPCLKWVKRGVAKANPEKVQLTKEELVQIINDTKSKLQLADQEGESSTRNQETSDNIDEEFSLDKYDEEDENTGLQQLGIHNIAEMPASAEENFDDEDDDSEKDDDIIKPSDNLLLVGRVNGDASILEVYIHNEEEGSLYCHHDLFLPAFPLCIEWMDFEPGQPQGNYCAIGSMSPVIDIWDLDIINCLEPAYTLGKKGNKKKKIKPVGHKDAVLDISWNPNFHHVLASGSVDQTILLWDIEAGNPSNKLTAFEEKVQCVKWHKLEGHVLLAGSCDQTAKVFDCRSTENKSWDLTGEAERVVWSTTEPYIFYVGTNTGGLHCFDCRKGEIWMQKAYEQDITGLSFSSQCPGLLLTTSSDGVMKVWDANGQSKYGAQMVYEKDLKMGVLHCIEMCPDSPFFFAAGGDNKSNNLTVADLLLNDPVKHYFGPRPLIETAVASGEPTTSNTEMEVTQE